MTSASTPFTGERKFNVVKILAGHEPCWENAWPDGERELGGAPTIFYFPDGQKMISGYLDKGVRLWNLKTGKEMKEARVVCEQKVYRVAVSRDSRWIIAGGDKGELKACEVNTGIIKTLKGHSSFITSIDISGDSKLLVSGSEDGTTRIWDLEVGNLMASTSTSPQAEDVCAVRFSQNMKRLAIMSENNFEVWNIEARRLESKIQKNSSYHTYVNWVPVLWTKNDRTIVAALSLNSRDPYPTTIYEVDASTLEIVGAPFQVHTRHIECLELSFDCTLLVSAANDNTIVLWAFESRHIIASFNGYEIHDIILSPDARQLAYTRRGRVGQRRIYICDIPPDILAKLWPGQEAPGFNVCENGDPLNFATVRRAAAQRNILPLPVAAQPLGHSPTTHEQNFFVLRYFRKLLSRKDKILAIAVEPYDPLDCPATSPRLSSNLSSVPATNLMDYNSMENSGHMLPSSQSGIRASSFISHLRHLSNWRPAPIGHALPPIIDVPLAEGQTRNAADGAPVADDGYVLDEAIDSRPTSRNSIPQRTPAGEHGGGRLCCF